MTQKAYRFRVGHSGDYRNEGCDDLFVILNMLILILLRFGKCPAKLTGILLLLMNKLSGY